MRLIFFGTAGLACPTLQALARWGAVEVLSVVTQPDRPQGRQLRRQPSPVKATAQGLGLPVLQPERARAEEFVQSVREQRPDLIVVVAYGQILSTRILEIPKHGCVNVHASLLPKYRGAAPIQWAILDGEPETGVTIMKMDAGLDTGPIISQEKTGIQPHDTAVTLHDRLASLGADLLLRTLPGYVAGDLVPAAQPESGSSYARKIVKEDGHIDWHTPAIQIRNRVRAFNPWPGAFTLIATRTEPVRLKIWEATVEDAGGNPGTVLNAAGDHLLVATSLGSLRILSLQREGGRRLGAREFLTSGLIKAGASLGAEAIP
jgi:methionyl-tRNA formyltransferase